MQCDSYDSIYPTSNTFSEPISDSSLVPGWSVFGSSYGKCRNGLIYNYYYQDYTCFCEYHCSWDKCRLEDPPNECLFGTQSKWFWDSNKNFWIAQILEGIEMFYLIND